MPDQNLPCDRLPALDPPIDLPAGGHPGARPAVAVIVFHGMGQQVKFQTLNDVAYGIRDAAIRAGSILAQPRTVLLRQRKSDGECRYIPRAELEVAESPGTAIHVYECYWAPLTEGKVTLRDVARFLMKTGIDGFRLGTRRFCRILFGDWKPYSIPGATQVHFTIALAFVLSLIVLNLVLGLVTSVGVLRGDDSGWPSRTLISWLTLDFLTFETAALAFAVSALVAYRQWDRFRESQNRSGGKHWKLPGRWLYLALAWAFVLATIGCGAAALFLLVWFRASDPGAAPLGLLFYAVIALATVVSWIVRSFLVQYFGDVVVYLSAHAVSQFDELRTRIQKTALDIASAVYDQDVYHRVILLGHSLGSVIAYDTFNAVANAGAHASALSRTDLITFGSPLDKTAFVFRSQKVDHADFREALATQIQAALARRDNRPASWVNISSKDDWISGELNFYGRVDNEVDAEACIPILAHVQYWRNNLVFDRTFEKVSEFV
jgi:hypothetical protein